MNCTMAQSSELRWYKKQGCFHYKNTGTKITQRRDGLTSTQEIRGSTMDFQYSTPPFDLERLCPSFPRRYPVKNGGAQVIGDKPSGYDSHFAKPWPIWWSSIQQHWGYMCMHIYMYIYIRIYTRFRQIHLKKTGRPWSLSLLCDCRGHSPGHAVCQVQLPFQDLDQNPHRLVTNTGWWFQPLWISQLGWWHSRYMESHTSHVPNHHPE